MEITAEIEQFFADPGRIAEVELTYQNGGRVLGTIRRVKLAPLRVVIQKSNPAKGERPRHKAVFDHVTHLRLTFADGSVKHV